MNLLHQEENFNPLVKLNSETMIATNLPIAINVLLPLKKVSDADGALEILLTTRVLVRPHTNAVVSKLEFHTTSPALLISEPLTARVILVILVPKNAASVMMVNSQLLELAQKFAKNNNHMLNATYKPKNAILNAHQDNQIAKTEITVI